MWLGEQVIRSHGSFRGKSGPEARTYKLTRMMCWTVPAPPAASSDMCTENTTIDEDAPTAALPRECAAQTIDAAAA